MARPMILDVDTGVDDAMAIALATRLSSHELLAVTTVAGNVTLDRATTNTLRVLAWLGADIPVFRGMSAPLVRPLHTATRVHAEDGLGGWMAPESSSEVGCFTAPEAILRYAREHKGELDGVFVGPLTNLAVALLLEPELAGWFRSVTIMGGAFRVPGNETPAAEFNIFVDPEAASLVARSGLPATWIGLDVTHQTSIGRDDWSAIVEGATPAADLVRSVSRYTFEVRGREQVYLHDPLAVAVAADPGLVEVQTGQVFVETSELARGETRCAAGLGNSRVATGVNASRFIAFFRESLGF